MATCVRYTILRTRLACAYLLLTFSTRPGLKLHIPHFNSEVHPTNHIFIKKSLKARIRDKTFTIFAATKQRCMYEKNMKKVRRVQCVF